mmetsp:Transcript_11912/g.42613  ORF Transcript_11912/g.42613 Transcript_11912/m.42613 type:complete len:267 (-) Transcript_11912:24-824(-)
MPLALLRLPTTPQPHPCARAPPPTPAASYHRRRARADWPAPPARHAAPRASPLRPPKATPWHPSHRCAPAPPPPPVARGLRSRHPGKRPRAKPWPLCCPLRLPPHGPPAAAPRPACGRPDKQPPRAPMPPRRHPRPGATGPGPARPPGTRAAPQSSPCAPGRPPAAAGWPRMGRQRRRRRAPQTITSRQWSGQHRPPSTMQGDPRHRLRPARLRIQAATSPPCRAPRGWPWPTRRRRRRAKLVSLALRSLRQPRRRPPSLGARRRT